MVVGGGASKERSVSKFAVETHILKGLKEFYNGREGTVQWVVSPDGDFYTICRVYIFVLWRQKLCICKRIRRLKNV